MKFDYQLSELANNDLNSIWQYSAESWSIKQADLYYSSIINRIKLICKNPEMGQIMHDVKPSHRMLIVQQHLIIYKFQNNVIYIDRILHQRMDIDTHLK